MKRMSFTLAMKEYFGLREGQNNMDFVKELKALTPEDRAYFIELLPSVGYEVVTA